MIPRTSIMAMKLAAFMPAMFWFRSEGLPVGSGWGVGVRAGGVTGGGKVQVLLVTLEEFPVEVIVAFWQGTGAV